MAPISDAICAAWSAGRRSGSSIAARRSLRARRSSSTDAEIGPVSSPTRGEYPCWRVSERAGRLVDEARHERARLARGVVAERPALHEADARVEGARGRERLARARLE